MLVTVEDQARRLRMDAAVRLLAHSSELTPYEALLLVCHPRPELHEASLERALTPRVDRRSRTAVETCQRCFREDVSDGACDFCGAFVG